MKDDEYDFIFGNRAILSGKSPKQVISIFLNKKLSLKPVNLENPKLKDFNFLNNDNSSGTDPV